MYLVKVKHTLRRGPRRVARLVRGRLVLGVPRLVAVVKVAVDVRRTRTAHPVPRAVARRRRPVGAEARGGSRARARLRDTKKARGARRQRSATRTNGACRRRGTREEGEEGEGNLARCGLPWS